LPDRSFIDQLADVWSALADMGRTLGPSDWAAPTECPGWSVQDHLSHVVGTESMLLGRPSPPSVPPGPHVLNPIGELNEAWVAQRRARPGAQVVAELVDVTAARLQSLRAMSDEQLDTPGPSPIGQVPYVTFMSVRVMDCWVHEQDMRQALGRPWRFAGPAAPAAVDRLTGGFGYVVGKKVAPPEGSVVVLDVEGPVPRTISVVMHDGRAVASDGVTPTVRLSMVDEVYVRLATGRLPSAAALDAGLVTIVGQQSTGEAVVANLAQMP
jgi:uncharacterized protein (TIGR03083 family)